MTAWRTAGSLDQLLDQLDAVAPDRCRDSDGGIGDPDHATRDSDHNPWWRLAGQGYVTARDFTHDPRGGLDCTRLAAALRAGLDRRVKYLIWNRQIMSGFDGREPWTWRPYAGKNPHEHHLHLSVVPDARALTRIPWLLPGLTVRTTRRPTVRLGSVGPDVELLQRFLGVRRPGELGYGLCDAATETAIRRYQAMRGLLVDGIAGPRTWAVIEQALHPRSRPADVPPVLS